MKKSFNFICMICLSLALVFHSSSLNQNTMAATEGTVIDTKLTQILKEATSSIEVIITFKNVEQVEENQLQKLKDVGIDNVIKFNSLPFVGALLTKSQIEQLSTEPSIQSIYYNAPLQYENESSTSVTGLQLSCKIL